jgi:hypothetical protein
MARFKTPKLANSGSRSGSIVRFALPQREQAPVTRLAESRFKCGESGAGLMFTSALLRAPRSLDANDRSFLGEANAEPVTTSVDAEPSSQLVAGA